MPNSIRVNTGAVKIEVNDAGECITLPFGDQQFPARYQKMLESIKEKQAESEARAKKIDESKMPKDEKDAAGIALMLEIHQWLRDQVDGLFGEGTCKKVFGDIVPGVELYEDFFMQLKPYFEKHGKERTAKMKKYSAVRTGNV